MITATDVSYGVGHTTILKDAVLTLSPGEVMAIAGPNGSGKSTLLRCLAGDLTPVEGAVTLRGRALGEYTLGELATRRAVLSQGAHISFPFRAHEIVAVGCTAFASEISAATFERIVRSTLQQVDALHLEERVFMTLSGGEQQRVHLARVLAQLWERRDVCLLLDEPTSALDIKHQHHVLGLARSVALERNASVCVVLHDLGLVQRYADRVALMKDGWIVAQGAPEDVLTDDNIRRVFEIDPALVALGMMPRA